MKKDKKSDGEKCFLPVDMTPVERRVLESAGVVFGKKHSETLVHATLPLGWRAAYNSAGDLELRDSQGRVQAALNW